MNFKKLSKFKIATWVSIIIFCLLAWTLAISLAEKL